MSEQDMRDGFWVLCREIAASYCYLRASEIADVIQHEFVARPVSIENSEALVRRVRELSGRPFPRSSYEVGYGDGMSNELADWTFALTEYCELPDDVDENSATAVAEYIKRLQEQVEGA